MHETPTTVARRAQKRPGSFTRRDSAETTDTTHRQKNSHKKTLTPIVRGGGRGEAVRRSLQALRAGYSKRHTHLELILTKNLGPSGRYTLKRSVPRPVPLALKNATAPPAPGTGHAKDRARYAGPRASIRARQGRVRRGVLLSALEVSPDDVARHAAEQVLRRLERRG